MIHFRSEGEFLHQGFNVYPWKDRATSVGFIFRCGDSAWWARWAPRVNKFYFGKQECSLQR